MDYRCWLIRPVPRGVATSGGGGVRPKLQFGCRDNFFLCPSYFLPYSQFSSYLRPLSLCHTSFLLLLDGISDIAYSSGSNKQGILTNNRYTQREFTLKFSSALLKPITLNILKTVILFLLILS